MLANRTPAPLPPLALSLTWKPVVLPTGANSAPRGELLLKKVAGRAFGELKALPTASQLISRRSPPNDPLAPAVVPPPRAVRNWSRTVLMAAASAPEPEKTNGWAAAGGAATRAARAPATAHARNEMVRLIRCGLLPRGNRRSPPRG